MIGPFYFKTRVLRLEHREEQSYRMILKSYTGLASPFRAFRSGSFRSERCVSEG